MVTLWRRPFRVQCLSLSLSLLPPSCSSFSHQVEVPPFAPRHCFQVSFAKVPSLQLRLHFLRYISSDLPKSGSSTPLTCFQGTLCLTCARRDDSVPCCSLTKRCLSRNLEKHLLSSWRQKVTLIILRPVPVELICLKRDPQDRLIAPSPSPSILH